MKEKDEEYMDCDGKCEECGVYNNCNEDCQNCACSEVCDYSIVRPLE